MKHFNLNGMKALLATKTDLIEVPEIAMNSYYSSYDYVPDYAPEFLMIVLVTLGTLYFLNQKHFLLPKPISAIVSKILFWPTLPITVVSKKEILRYMVYSDR